MNICKNIYKYVKNTILIFSILLVFFSSLQVASFSYERKDLRNKGIVLSGYDPTENPLNNPEDTITPGKEDTQDLFDNGESESKKGSTARKKPNSEGNGIIQTLVRVLIIYLAYPIYAGELVGTAIGLKYKNTKLDEKIDKGIQKLDEELQYETNSIHKETIKRYFSIQKIFFLDYDLFNANYFSKKADKNESENTSTDSERFHEKISKGVASTYRLTTLIAITFGFILFILGSIILIKESIVSATPHALANHKNFILNTVKSIVLIAVLPYIFALIFGIHDMFLGMLRVARDSFVEKGNIGFDLLMYYFKQNNTISVIIGEFIIFFYALKYAYIYIQRALTIIVYVVGSPIVCMTYAIDKIKDGESQVLNVFAKDFINVVLLGLLYPGLYLILTLVITPAAKKEAFILVVAVFGLSRIEKLAKELLGIRGLKTIRSTDGPISSSFEGH